MNKVTVIIASTGAKPLSKAIESVLNQTIPTNCYVVCDGDEYRGAVKVITDNYLGNPNFKVAYLPINVGAKGFYGHRIYAAFTHLVNTEFLVYMDQDCWMENNHVESCLKSITSKDLQWTYSLRKICGKLDDYICNDDCESLGKWNTYHGVNMIDTSCYFVKTEVATKLTSVWHGGWGVDRAYYSVLNHHFKKYDCTGEYTINYRVGSNEGSVTGDFFINGNKIMNDKYNGVLPWRAVS